MNTIGKFIITFALLFGFHVNSFAQNENDSPPPPPPMLIAEQMPSYKGGEDAMSSFIRENVKYPKKAKKKGITGTC